MKFSIWSQVLRNVHQTLLHLVPHFENGREATEPCRFHLVPLFKICSLGVTVSCEFIFCGIPQNMVWPVPFAQLNEFFRKGKWYTPKFETQFSSKIGFSFNFKCQQNPNLISLAP